MKSKDSSKSVGAGISLEPELIERAKALAKKRGFTGLSPFVRVLLHDEINRNTYLLQETTGNADSQPHSGPGVLKPQKQFAGGLRKASTAKKETRYKPKRRAS